VEGKGSLARCCQAQCRQAQVVKHSVVKHSAVKHGAWQAGGGVSTRVIVTGGAGFIGTLLARRLLAGPHAFGDGGPAPVDELVLADLVAPPPGVAAGPRVRGDR
jgi:hypothetical protein